MEESDSAVFCTQGSRTSQFAEQDTPRFLSELTKKLDQNKIRFNRLFVFIRGSGALSEKAEEDFQFQ